MNEEKLAEWIKLAVQNEDISKYKIDVEGKTNKDEGYLGNIYFVSVTGGTSDGNEKCLRLVIKCSKESVLLRQQIPIKETFYKEIYIYDRVLKIFDNLQKEKGGRNFLTFMPRCYATQRTETGELLILENLKSQGFDVWNRKMPMTFEHVELVLRAYGKWHAFSLALRRKKRDIFEKLVENNINMFTHFVMKVGSLGLTLELFKQSRDTCIQADELDILEKLNFSKSDANYIISDLFSEDPEDSVIVHGDCWNNNFMFTYKEDAIKPVDVRILDWQCSGLASPVMDLSHFIYGCCDTGNHKDVKELLKVYHESLSECLRYLECDPEELFSYNKLIEHWKKFSRYGLLIQAFVLKFSTCETNDAPDFAEAAEQGKEFMENFNIGITNPEEYYRRVRNNLLHYVENLK